MKRETAWTQEMVDYMLANQEKSSEEIGRHLGLSHTSVSRKFRELGVRRSNHKRYDWTAEKDAYLREHWPDEPACDIADALGTCYGVVKGRADELGLEKSPGFTTQNYRNRWCKDYKHSIRKVA